jgi:hypothetical protein
MLKTFFIFWSRSYFGQAEEEFKAFVEKSD